MVSEEHECEWTSLCCGAEPHEYVEEFCAGCNEYAEFECIVCEGESYLLGLDQHKRVALVEKIC